MNHGFNEHLLSTYYMSFIVSCIEDTEMNKIGRLFCLVESAP